MFVRVFVLTALLIFSGAADAQQLKLRQVDRSHAAMAANKLVKGRVLKVDASKPNIYRVKVLKPDGRVVMVNVDKRTGKVAGTNQKKQ